MFLTIGKKLRQRCPKCLLRTQRKISRRKLFWIKFKIINFFGHWTNTLCISGEIDGHVFKIQFYLTTGLYWGKISFLKQTGVQEKLFLVYAKRSDFRWKFLAALSWLRSRTPDKFLTKVFFFKILNSILIFWLQYKTITDISRKKLIARVCKTEFNVSKQSFW